jgi:hypothetical protein
MPHDPLAHIRYTPGRPRLAPGVLPSRRAAAGGSAAGFGLAGTAPIVIPPLFTGFALFVDGTGPYYDETGLQLGGQGISVDGTGPYLDVLSTLGVQVDVTGPFSTAA